MCLFHQNTFVKTSQLGKKMQMDWMKSVKWSIKSLARIIISFSNLWSVRVILDLLLLNVKSKSSNLSYVLLLWHIFWQTYPPFMYDISNLDFSVESICMVCEEVADGVQIRKVVPWLCRLGSWWKLWRELGSTRWALSPVIRWVI